MPRAFLHFTSALLLAALGYAGLFLWRFSIENNPDQSANTARLQQRIASPHKPALWKPLLDHTLSLETRLDIVRSIDTETTEAGLNFLFETLTHTPPQDAVEDWWVIMNEIMQHMRLKGVGADQFTDRLSALIQNPSQHEIARDYAIQHLAQWIAPAGGDSAPGETNPAKFQLALTAIATAAADPALSHSTVAGTALMALMDASSRLPQELTAPTWDTLRPYLAKIIGGEAHAATHFRASAIQAVALRGDTTHLATIRDLASRESTDPSLRLSSISALGLYADPADRPYLESLASGTTKFRYAAQAALANNR